MLRGLRMSFDGAGGELAEDDLLGDAAAERHRDARLEPAPRVCRGGLPSGGCVTPSAGPRGMIVTLCTGSWSVDELADQRVAGLVPRRCVRFSSSLMTIERRSVPMRTLSLAISKSAIADGVLVLTGGEERGLVDEVLEVGAGEARACRAR